MKTRLNILEERVLSFKFNDDVILGTLAHVEEGQLNRRGTVLNNHRSTSLHLKERLPNINDIHDEESST